MATEVSGFRVLRMAEAEKAKPAVQWDMKENFAEWGRTEGAEAWAVPIIEGSLSRVVGKVSAGVLQAFADAVERIPESERRSVLINASAAANSTVVESHFRWTWASVWNWPWECDEGSTLCRAAVFVLDEVFDIWPRWNGLSGVRDALEKAGASAWDEGEDGKPALAVRVLVAVAAAKWYRDTRLQALPIQAALGIVTATAGTTLWKPDGERSKVWNLDAESKKSAMVRSISDLGEVVPAIDGRSDFWLLQQYSDKVFQERAELGGVLSIHLLNTAMEQWRRGDDYPENVFIPASRDGMVREIGRRVEPDSVRRAIEWLMGIRVYGWSLVEGFDLVAEHPEHAATRGRRTPYFRVKVGEGLHPWDGIKACLLRGYSIPERARFLSPVLPLSEVPLFGDSRTYDRQRVSFSYLIGAVLVEHREQYLDWGGIEVSLLQAALRRHGGMYVRSHADMTERAIESYLATPKQLSLEGGRGAVLERFVKVVGGKDVPLVRLGDGYKAEEALVKGAAGVTKRQRHRARGKGSNGE